MRGGVLGRQRSARERCERKGAMADFGGNAGRSTPRVTLCEVVG